MRLRFFGGTSYHWVGYCLRLDEEDFKTWPIKRKDLYQYETEAQKILDIGSFDASDQRLAKVFNSKNNNVWHEPKAILRSPPVKFAEKFKDRLGQSKLIHVCLNSNLVEIDVDQKIKLVKTIVIKGQPKSKGVALDVSSTKLILAMGAIEVTRYLLLLNEKNNSVKLIDPNILGSNFLEHPHYDWDDPAAYLITPKGKLKKHGYSNDLKFSDAKEMIAITPVEKKNTALNYAFTFVRQNKDFVIESSALAYWKFIANIGKIKSTEYDVHMVNLQTESSFNANSKISLGADKDDFGLKKVVLSVEMDDLTQKTTTVALHNLQRELVDIGGALFRVVDKPSGYMGGAHPMGTTKMGLNEASGVVDSDLKVFGLSNLYVCSASVFPTGGYANPTYSIVNLALRLSYHLKG